MFITARFRTDGLFAPSRVGADQHVRAFAPTPAVLAFCCAQLTLFAAVVVLARIAVPFWDMLSFVDAYLSHREIGQRVAYLWLPDNEHHSVWSRLFTIIEFELFDGHGPSFQLFSLACLLGGLLAFALEVGRTGLPGRLRANTVALSCALFLTVPAAVDCAVPMNGGYVQAAGFTMLALVLLDGWGEERGHAGARRVAAIVAAVAASFGNAVGLLAWPILAWSAWRGRLGWQWRALVAAYGAGFTALYLMHLLASPATPAVHFLYPEHLAKVAGYALAYAGLPWTRAPALALPGRVVGAVLLACSLAAVARYGWGRPLPSRFERVCTGLILFSMGTVALAAVGRPDLATEIAVPVRYAVLLAPMHAGLLGLALQAMARTRHGAKASVLATGLAAVLFTQQIPAAAAAIRASRGITETVQRFVAGQRDDAMRSTVFPDLAAAERIFARLDAAGAYRWLLAAKPPQSSFLAVAARNDERPNAQ
jgi:hypothetical protein